MEETNAAPPVKALRESVRAYVAEMRALGLDPNRSVAFCPDPHGEIPVDTRGWLLIDPLTSHERWLLLDDGDVWHETQGDDGSGLRSREPTYEWLPWPSEALARLLTHSLHNAGLGGSGFLSDEERFARRPYVVGDRRARVTDYVGEERRRSA